MIAIHDRVYQAGNAKIYNVMITFCNQDSNASMVMKVRFETSNNDVEIRGAKRNLMNQ